MVTRTGFVATICYLKVLFNELSYCVLVIGISGLLDTAFSGHASLTLRAELQVNPFDRKPEMYDTQRGIAAMPVRRINFNHM